MIKCSINGVFVGSKDLVNRNGSTTKTVNIFIPELEKQFPIFRCDLPFTMGQIVELPCELRVRQDGTPYFVYLAPSDAQQKDADKNK